MQHKLDPQHSLVYEQIFSLHLLYGSMDTTICQFDSFFKKYLLKNFAKFLRDETNQLMNSSFDDKDLKVLDSGLKGSVKKCHSAQISPNKMWESEF